MIFAAYALVSRTAAAVSRERLSSRKASLRPWWRASLRTRQRPPTSDEVEGLVRDRVREEVYYREALALGLDKDDIIIRRRVAAEDGIHHR